MEYSFLVTMYRARQASQMQSRSSRTRAEFGPDSPIGDGKSTSGSPRINPSGLDLLGYMDCFVVSGSKVVEGMGSSLSPPWILAL